MGKLIITEEEKKRIQLLYEVNDAPPSESVLVANKNPYKYTEYESARQTYSPKLKDGDLFFQTKNDNEYEKFAKQHNESKIQEFVKGMIGKTFRADYDTTFRIDEITKISESYRDDWKFVITDLSSQEKKTGFMTILGYLTADKVYSTIRFHLTEKTPLGLYYIEPPKLNETYYKYVETNCIIDRFGAGFWLCISCKYRNTVPDEYFEIRKIQRQKTDF